MLIQDILNAPVLISGNVTDVGLFTYSIFPFDIGECYLPDELIVNYIDEDEEIGYLTYKDRVVLVFNKFESRILNYEVWTELVMVMQRSDGNGDIKIAELTDEV